ncbi:hypothetical protein [Brevundimonas sp.]|uniref:hypothetical protein n=1 Tax=Brevundimonas sp. TaxID=1871086 RepID=UPI0027309271|nr:hypothetical protein [Brevundimonas sp.]MDP1913577.1 hypothetical protein [Brevundimonas sp.]
MILALLIALVGHDAPAPPLVRAELCSAHIEAFIVEQAEATGMVAGPSWFIRSWWSARLPEDGAPEALSDEQRTALIAAMPDRKAADPEAFGAEREACLDEAIDAGAVPGMGPG